MEAKKQVRHKYRPDGRMGGMARGARKRKRGEEISSC